MPVPAQVGGVDGDNDYMAGAAADLLRTARAHVRLRGLKGVNAADLDGSAQRGINAHRSRAAMTAKAATTIR
jgi:hypothetical protein